MAKRSRRNRQQDFEQDNEQVEPNRRQKKILNHNLKLKYIEPITDNQEKIFNSYFSDKNVFIHGVAGTGKSYISLYLALNDLLQGHFKKIIICRSTVSLREVGHLPGTLEEKLSVFEEPYRAIVDDLFQRKGAYDLLKTKGSIEFMSTSFLRGLTFDNSFIFVDECQNMNSAELHTIFTRVGEGSRLIVAGDRQQNDLEFQKKKEVSGIENMLKIAKAMNCFDVIDMKLEDIVRSGFAKQYLITKYNLGLE